MCMVGGMTRVWNDVPPYMIVDGNPARCRGPNVIGLKRNGLSEEACRQAKRMYKIMCRSGLNVSQALQEIEGSIKDGPERNHFIEFARRSTRGITQG